MQRCLELKSMKWNSLQRQNLPSMVKGKLAEQRSFNNPAQELLRRRTTRYHSFRRNLDGTNDDRKKSLLDGPKDSPVVHPEENSKVITGALRIPSARLCERVPIANVTRPQSYTPGPYSHETIADMLQVQIKRPLSRHTSHAGPAYLIRPTSHINLRIYSSSTVNPNAIKP